MYKIVKLIKQLGIQKDRWVALWDTSAVGRMNRLLSPVAVVSREQTEQHPSFIYGVMMLNTALMAGFTFNLYY